MDMSCQLHAPAALPQGKRPWYPLDRRLGGPQSRSGRGGEEKNSRPLSGIEPWNPDRPARSLPIILTEPSRLLVSKVCVLYWFRKASIVSPQFVSYNGGCHKRGIPLKCATQRHVALCTGWNRYPFVGSVGPMRRRVIVTSSVRMIAMSVCTVDLTSRNLLLWRST
jgi:hypothetical protein